MGTDRPKTTPRPRARPPGTPTPGDAAELIKGLTDFVSRMGPAVGERRDGLYLADDDTTPAIVRARDDALVSAFRAIERLAALHQGEG